jgi:hypothetical protein
MEGDPVAKNVLACPARCLHLLWELSQTLGLAGLLRSQRLAESRCQFLLELGRQFQRLFA